MLEGGMIAVMFIALMALGLGIFLLFGSDRSRQKVLFSLLNIFAAIWIASNYIGSNGGASSVTHIFVLADYIVGVVLAVIFWLFLAEVRSRTVQKDQVHPSGLALVVAAAIAIGTMILTVAGLVVDIDVSGQLKITNESFYFVYPIVVFGFVLLGVKDLGVARVRVKNRIDRTQLNLIMVGLTVAATFVLVPNLILENILSRGPLLDMSYDSAYVGILVFLVLSSYAIVRHGLFDVKAAAIRSAAYILSLLTLSLVYYLLAYLVSVMLFNGQSTADVSISPVNILLALILAFIFQPVKHFFDRVTNRVFYRDRYDRDEFYVRLNAVLTSTSDLRSLLQRASTTIGNTLKSSQTFFFVSYSDARYITAGTEKYRHLPPRDVEQLDSYIDEHGDEVIITQLLEKKSPIARLLLAHKISLLVPLVREGALLGYLALGEQLGSGYTKRDVSVLHTIVDELIIAIQNALSVQEIKDINANLEQRVGMATAELRTSNARLRRVDAAKDEFLSMASHQLRTPLTSIKGYLSMVLEGDVGKVSPAQRKVLEEAFISSERMVHLIHDFLNVSRLQTGKFLLEKSVYDLAKLVKEEVDSLQGVAKSRGISIVYHASHRAIPMTIDDTKLRQVLINYIDNALYYSPEGSKVEVRLRKLTSKVELTVADAGIGVPKSEQAQLFAKFYRASNARKHRPDGTGVGLYLAKKIITAHGGDILFSSREGRGSMFGFWLPLENSADQLDAKPNNK